MTEPTPTEPNIWLDDERPEPEDWLRCKTARGCIARLSLLNMVGTRCNILSLDHDLGDDLTLGTGYDVLNWIEEQLHTNEKFVPPREIRIHTANPAARTRMELAVESINRHEKRQPDGT